MTIYNSKFERLFRSLTSNEKRQLKEWIISPINNKHKDVIKLYKYLFKRKKASSVAYQKKRIFQYIYPDKIYDDTRLRYILNLALDVLEKFVRYNLQVSTSKNSDFLWIHHLNNRKLPKYAQQELDIAQKQLQQTPHRSDQYYLNHFRLEAERMEITGTQHRIGTNNLQDISRSLSLFFMINTLRYACIHLSHQNLRKADCNIILLQAILQEIEQNDYQAFPLVMAYYYAYKVLESPQDEQYFIQLKYYLLNSQTIFPDDEYKSLFLQALNYCIRRLNIGGETYIREAFELYKYGIENQVLLDKGEISPFAYKNVVALGLRLEKFDWVSQFIPSYATHLQESYRGSYVQYNTARLHFAKGDYDQCLKLLAQTDYDDVFMSMDAKILLLKIYYEEKEYDALESLLASASVFLQRKKIMGYHKEHYKNVIYFIKRILAISPIDRTAKEQLQQQIMETEPLAERPWLIQQLSN